MSTAAKEQHPTKNTRTTFTVVERQIACAHNIQLYVDYGSSDGGPWLKIGINETEFGIGYLPTRQEASLRVADAEKA